MAHTLATPVIAGNWKLNHGPAETRRFFAEFSGTASEGTVLIFPPSLSLAAARAASAEDILLGVQNIYWEDSGAFTGEVSAPMARDAGASVVLVGHSERRHVFGETDGETGRKVRAVLDAGLTAMLCVGERIEEREGGQAKDIVSRQIEAGLEGVTASQLDHIAVAYEPVWAIGTGKTATARDASEMHAHIRAELTRHFGKAASAVPILYGGSVKPENAGELLSAPEIDGVLVGGASLSPDSFGRIRDARG